MRCLSEFAHEGSWTVTGLPLQPPRFSVDASPTMGRPKNSIAAGSASPTPALPADLSVSGITPGCQIAQWPGVMEAALHEAESRRMFQRTLALWATDVLRLKRRGLDVPVNRRSVPMQAMPAPVAYRRAA